jgi:hypothetical protein
MIVIVIKTMLSTYRSIYTFVCFRIKPAGSQNKLLLYIVNDVDATKSSS